MNLLIAIAQDAAQGGTVGLMMCMGAGALVAIMIGFIYVGRR